MAWIYWLVGVLWIFDGFLYFAFPRFVKQMLIRAYKEARFWAAGLGPAVVGTFLAVTCFFSESQLLLVLLSALSFIQAGLLFYTIRTTSPRPMERLLSLPNPLYRLWGLFLTFLGPYLIYLRP